MIFLFHYGNYITIYLYLQFIQLLYLLTILLYIGGFMFESITFHDIVLEKPSRENESFEIANYQVANEDDLTQYYQTPRENMKFLLEGRAKTLLPMPLSDYARDNLLYMQVFSLYDASGRMYTQRKNFPY